MKLFTHDTSTGTFEELDDGLNLRTIRNLILDLVDDIEHTRLAMEQQTVGIGDVLLYFLVDASLVHHRRVGSIVNQRFATCHDERRHILREGTTCLYQCQTSHTGIGILDGTRGEDHTIVDLAVASNLHTIAEDAVVAHDGIVADVRAFEQEVIIADLRHTVAVGTAVDDDVLTDDIIVANLHIRLLTTEVEVLRQGGNHAALVDLVIVANT